MALMKCPECGKEVSDHAENCPNCGYVLSKNIAYNLSEQANPDKAGKIQTTNRKRRKIIVTSILVLLCAISIFLGVTYWKNVSAAKQTDKIISQIGNVSLYSSDKIKNAEKSFNALTKKQKKYVTKHKTLESAKEEYKRQFCLSVVPTSGSGTFEITTTFENNTLTVIENSTNTSYGDVMFGSSALSPTIASSCQTAKDKIDAEGFKDVNVYFELQASGITLVRAKNGETIS